MVPSTMVVGAGGNCFAFMQLLSWGMVFQHLRLLVLPTHDIRQAPQPRVSFVLRGKGWWKYKGSLLHVIGTLEWRQWEAVRSWFHPFLRMIWLVHVYEGCTTFHESHTGM